jgi:hypothetical protein
MIRILRSGGGRRRLLRCSRSELVDTEIGEWERYMMACFGHCLIGGMRVASLYSRDVASILSEHEGAIMNQRSSSDNLEAVPGHRALRPKFIAHG